MSGPRLVVGADGGIGSALLDHWRASAERAGASGLVRGTSRRAHAADRREERIAFDLADDADPWPEDWPPGAAVICAGITSLAACRADPDATRRINVDCTLRLIEALATRHDAHVVLLSSNLVFDGTTPAVPSDAPHSPRTEYGRQKADLEAAVRSQGIATIVRLTKVVHPGWPLLTRWIEVLQAERTVEAHGDQFFAPVAMDVVIAGISAIVERSLTGTWQLSGPEDVSYSTVARHIASRLGRPLDLVVETHRSDAPDLEPAPAHTTLDSREAATALGLRFAPPEALFDVLVDAARAGNAQPR